jgi:adenylate kinase family enzyme
MSTLTVAAPDDLECRFILILGKPGGGKGTISGKILEVGLERLLFLPPDIFCLPFSHTIRTFCVQDFPQLHHLSTGDLLRQHVREKTTLGIEAKSFMDDGKLVPDSLMIDLVMKDATPILEEGRSLLLDGFPRTIEQAKALDDVVNVDMVINLDIPTETIVARIADRYVV